LVLVLFGGGVEVVPPVCPVLFDEPLMSGLTGGGAAGSGGADGETGVKSGFVPGTAFGFVLGVKLGLVSGVTFGFGTASGATLSGGMVLLGLVVVLLGLVEEPGVVLCVLF
jgi:hypothetical protein